MPHSIPQLPTLKVFVSSTYLDLIKEREAVSKAAIRFGIPVKFIGMEMFGSREDAPPRVSVDEVIGSDIYVGIFGGRYGSGVTEAEYRAAGEKRKRRFIYLKRQSRSPLPTDPEPEKRARQAALKKELKEQHTCTWFTSPDNLASQLSADLHKFYVTEYLLEWAEELYRSREVPGFAPYQVRPRDNFVGRRAAMRALVKALAPAERAPVVGIHGMSGVGKTALALEAAERLRADYLHAQLFIEFNGGGDDPQSLAQALWRAVRDLGGKPPSPGAGLDELSKSYVSTLRGRRALILLDDVVSEEQVELFRPPPGCALLLTSQEKLGVPGIRHFPLNQFQAHEARALLSSIEPRIGQKTADEIAGLCAHLPLALRIAGTLLSVTPDLAPAVYARQLRDERTRLLKLARKVRSKGEVVTRGVEASFNVSYERLGAEARSVFRHLAVFPASFDRKAQRAVCRDASGEHLSDLARRSFVIYDGKARRYRLHALLRIYADRQVPPAERELVGRRHAEHFLKVARSVERGYRRGPAGAARALKSFDFEWENLRAGQAWAAARLRTSKAAAALCVDYAEALKYLLYLRLRPDVLIKWLDAALDASRRLKLRETEGRLLCTLGTAYSLSEPKRAVELYQQALGIARELDDRRGAANALGSLGNIYTGMGRTEDARKSFQQCVPILQELGDAGGIGSTWNNVGNALASLGASRQAIRCYKKALEAARAVGDRRGEAIASSNLGDEYAGMGKTSAAVKHYKRALVFMNEADDRRGKAALLTGLGSAYSRLGKHRPAIEFHQQALAISEELDDRAGMGDALGNLGNAYAESGEILLARSQHRRALKISRELKALDSEIRDLGNLGHTYYLVGDTDRAIKCHRRALKLSRRVANPYYRGIALWNIALSHSRAGQADAARAHAVDALRVFEQLKHPFAARVREFLDGLEVLPK